MMKEIILSFIVAVLVYKVVWYAYGCRDVLSLMVSVLSFWGCCITAFLWQSYRCMKKKQQETEAKDGGTVKRFCPPNGKTNQVAKPFSTSF